MKIIALKAFAISAIIGCISPTAAHGPRSKAESIIAASKVATGGKLWDAAQGCHETGTHGDRAYTTRFSLLRYGMRVDSDQGGNILSMGFDGKARWRAAGGKTDVRTDAGSLQEAILTNYLSINGFYFPTRFPATFKYLREATKAGRKFDVLEITPEGSRSIEAWFDRRSRLIARVVDRNGQPPVTVEASNYRRVDGLTIAYSLIVRGSDGKIADRGALNSFSCGPIDHKIFNPPIAR